MPWKGCFAAISRLEKASKIFAHGSRQDPMKSYGAFWSPYRSPSVSRPWALDYRRRFPPRLTCDERQQFAELHWRFRSRAPRQRRPDRYRLVVTFEPGQKRGLLGKWQSLLIHPVVVSRHIRIDQ